MNKLVLILSLIVVVFLAGCSQENGGGIVIIPPKNTPFIQDVEPSKNFIYAFDDVDILITVKNPTKVNFLGKALLQVDNNECFNVNYISDYGFQNVRGIIKDISVNAEKSNPIVITLRTSSSLSDFCFGSHKITVFLFQESPTPFDVKTIELPLVKK